MNILIFNWRDPKNPRSGGAEIVTLEYAKAWVKAGNKVTWLANRFKGSSKEENMDGITIVRRGNSVTQFFLFPQYYLAHKRNFDLVVDEVHGLPYLTPLFVRVKKIAFIHEIAGDIWDRMFSFPFNKIGLLAEKLFFSFYTNTQFITVSESTKTELIQFGIKKVRVIHNGFSFPPAIPAVKEKDPTYIFISRLVKMKGIEDVLKTFTIISRSQSSAKLWIVGDGEIDYLKELQSLVEERSLEEKVHFFGKVTEAKKYDLLRRAHLLLHASVKEGWGLVVIEAASQGTPAIVYNVAGLRDSVKNDQTGIVVKENTPQCMANAALDLLSDKKKYMRFERNSKEWAKSLRWDSATKKTLELLDTI